MTEPELIYPNSYGFSGQFLTNVVISPPPNINTTIQVYSLPKEYCSHNYISYFSNQYHKIRLNWFNNSEHFQICYLYQFPGKNINLTAELIADGLTEASYAYQEDYQNGNFSGNVISKYTKVPFELNDGLIVRVQGYPSMSSPYFDLTLNPSCSPSNDEKKIEFLPFYFVVTPNGYNFSNDLNISLDYIRDTKTNLSLDSILGIALSSAILFLVIILASVYFSKKYHYIKSRKTS